MRISESNISELKDNEVFVFGSNLSGIHGAGAARLAYEKFDAEWGIGVGPIGKCYAIPTKDYGIKRTLSVSEIKLYVDRFMDHTLLFPGNDFLVTEIGCGLAGHSIEDIAPLFEKALKIENIYLPKRFIEAL